ncbi:MAG: tRNA (adenosine(37)-N6)-threonylcarbamoyltransferase complex dimerization subunit type 1 TsaB [Deltaproteobacteria bacterium]|nr:tRNA (adenosine(37)-N6)-threonylcarbamoyltransferase complex dimerization subunit type 1 TsaB [Deltaproteobacteria bacterium]
MKILSVDTSSTGGSVALTEKGRLVGELTVGLAGTHSVWLLKGLDGFLKDIGFSIEDVDVFAFGVGPGSFTGLRIGASVVKGLAWALKRPVAGVSTLKSLAMNVPYTDLRVCPILDARKKEVYAAVFTFSNGECKRVIEDCCVSVERLFTAIAETRGGPVIFLGNALKTYEGLIRENFKDAIIAPEHLWDVRASNIGLLAEKNPVFNRPAELKPLYLRRPEAEIKKAGKEG